MKKKIENWLYQHARDLEQARYDYHFKQGDKARIIKTLRQYQNTDGGFAHGLEPDFTTPASNPIDTWTATRILDELSLESAHPMIKRILDYLEKTPHMKDGLYYFRIPDNNNHPHAEWWHYEPGKETEGYNPTASLLGFRFVHTATGAKKDQIRLEVDQAIQYFLNNQITEMHELRSFVELYHYIRPAINHPMFFEKLKDQILMTVEKDPAMWFDSYCAKPSQLIINPETPGYEIMKPLVFKEHTILKQQIETRDIWEIEWTWGQYPEAFLKAKQAWEGIRALENLIRFKRFSEL